VGGVHRRDLLGNVLAASVGAASVESVERVLGGLDQLPHRVGLAEVEATEHAAGAYMAFDLARQSDLAAVLARRSLRWSISLLEKPMTDPIRARLHSAIGLLSDRFGWEIYDRGQSARAQNTLILALDHAARGADRDLRAHVLLDLSTVTTDAGAPRDGVEILRVALGDERISSAQRANLHGVAARHCGTAGLRESGLRHIGLAEEALSRTDAAMAPDWARQITYSPGHHDSVLGLALYELGDADRARTRLNSALTRLDSGRTRTLLRCRTRLAALHFRDGDPDAGRAVSERVLVDAAGIDSTRVHGDLTMLRADAARFGAPDLAAELSALLTE
jgi:hypothetical protein